MWPSIIQSNDKNLHRCCIKYYITIRDLTCLWILIIFVPWLIEEGQEAASRLVDLSFIDQSEECGTQSLQTLVRRTFHLDEDRILKVSITQFKQSKIIQITI